MNLLLCLTFLAIASCASAATVTISVWTSSGVKAAYTQTLTLPDGTTIEGMMNAAAANGNKYFAWSYLGTDFNLAYLKIDGISDNASTKMYWALFKMSDVPLVCGSKFPASSQFVPYKYASTPIEDGANYVFWYLKFPKPVPV